MDKTDETDIALQASHAIRYAAVLDHDWQAYWSELIRYSREREVRLRLEKAPEILLDVERDNRQRYEVKALKARMGLWPTDLKKDMPPDYEWRAGCKCDVCRRWTPKGET